MNFKINSLERNKHLVEMLSHKPSFKARRKIHEMDNRKKISQKKLPPAVKQFKETKHTRDIKSIVSKYFDTHSAGK